MSATASKSVECTVPVMACRATTAGETVNAGVHMCAVIPCRPAPASTKTGLKYHN